MGLSGFAQVMQNIDNIYARRIDDLKKVMLIDSREMLRDFRGPQYAAEKIDTGKAKADTATAMQKAIAYAKEHSGGGGSVQRGIPWKNRSFRAARGVHAYVNMDDKEMVIGLMHTMSYGAYLEYANNRQHAVIEPIVRAHIPQILQDIKMIFAGDGAP